MKEHISLLHRIEQTRLGELEYDVIQLAANSGCSRRLLEQLASGRDPKIKNDLAFDCCLSEHSGFSRCVARVQSRFGHNAHPLDIWTITQTSCGISILHDLK